MRRHTGRSTEADKDTERRTKTSTHYEGHGQSYSKLHIKAHASGQGRVGIYHVHGGRKEMPGHSSTKNREECTECLGMGLDRVGGRPMSLPKNPRVAPSPLDEH